MNCYQLRFSASSFSSFSLYSYLSSDGFKIRTESAKGFLNLVWLKVQVNGAVFVLVTVLIFMPGSFKDIGVDGFIKEKLNFLYWSIVVPYSKVRLYMNLLVVISIWSKLFKENDVLHSWKVVCVELFVVVGIGNYIPVVLLAIDLVRSNVWVKNYLRSTKTAKSCSEAWTPLMVPGMKPSPCKPL